MIVFRGASVWNRKQLITLKNWETKLSKTFEPTEPETWRHWYWQCQIQEILEKVPSKGFCTWKKLQINDKCMVFWLLCITLPHFFMLFTELNVHLSLQRRPLNGSFFSNRLNAQTSQMVLVTVQNFIGDVSMIIPTVPLFHCVETTIQSCSIMIRLTTANKHLGYGFVWKWGTRNSNGLSWIIIDFPIWMIEMDVSWGYISFPDTPKYQIVGEVIIPFYPIISSIYIYM